MHVSESKPIHLSFLDKTQLRNVYNIYESACDKNDFCRDKIFPVIEHTNISTFLNEYSSRHIILINFLKQIPEFSQLPMNDRICILRNNFGFINNINSAVLHPGITTNLILSTTNIFGSTLSNRLLQSIERIQMFTYDVILLKLLLIIITFSSASLRNQTPNDLSEISTNSVMIFSAQNIYVEILWKYIQSKTSNEIETVKFFSKIIEYLMFLLDVHLLLDGFIHSSPSEVEKMDSLMQSMWPTSSLK